MLFEVFLNCTCCFCIGFTKLFLETTSDCKAIWSSWNSSGPGPTCPNPELFWFQKYISEALTSETSAETLKYISISTLAVCISQMSFSNTSGQLWPQKLHDSRFTQPALLQIQEKRNTHDQLPWQRGSAVARKPPAQDSFRRRRRWCPVTFRAPFQ